ncbi:lactococcin 972 family bacteriocin [Streptomyces sp. FH025]|uniref:lactococcin 972 family bacteriocin n=1 Tax=Streptomyces sp. FH025 TaxID=2815937 RepID=UPI001A9D78EF|nr:lactococcin 972 family bacteriocin [Streptomyces sp. FH025]MBO1416238.1 lactococcin 972 family bacteriocin [Streptomyces sp. FH025]
MVTLLIQGDTVTQIAQAGSAPQAVPVQQAGSANLSNVVNVGGGTWSYGTVADGSGLKGCYSNYLHNSKGHGATAILANSNDKVHASAGNWANAYAVAGWAYTCNTYWSVD